ncbi:MAG: RluA family pseudouridine synthase [Myxococcota bacterium]|nr:RluA family pseudouridine synthase [Myxococcota bacterium]
MPSPERPGLPAPHTHRVPDGTPSDRLDRYASGVAELFASTSQAHQAARKGTLQLNGEVVSPGRRVHPGDVLTSDFVHGPPRRVFAHPLSVLLEDEFLAVIDKPAGLLVNGNRHRTVERALPFNLTPSDQPDALSTPRPVHRLDVPTGGLLLVAKTASAAAGLGRQLEDRTVHKRYRALVVGRLVGADRIDVPVEGRSASSRYAAVEHTRSLHCSWVTTVDLWPETGRTHQLRRHLAELGHPVLGDPLYSDEATVLRRCGLFLRAVALRFSHPSTGEDVALSVPEPHKFGSFRTREARRWNRVHEQG